MGEYSGYYWAPGMKREDRNVFESLMNMARQHASSCTVAPLLDLMEAMFLSISNDGRTGISDGSKEQLPEGALV